MHDISCMPTHVLCLTNFFLSPPSPHHHHHQKFLYETLITAFRKSGLAYDNNSSQFSMNFCFQFLADTFNALFAIMEEMAEEVGDLVFEALVINLILCSQVEVLCHISVFIGVHNWTTCCRKIWKFSSCLRHILWKVVSCCKCAYVSLYILQS